MEAKINDAPPRTEEASRLELESEVKNKEFGEHLPEPAELEYDESTAEDPLLCTPYIPDHVYSALPKLLQEGCKVFENKRERDVFLISALTILSGCMKTISGTYHKNTVHPHLFSFIIAPAASGKSALSYAMELAKPYHLKLVAERNEKLRQYKLELGLHERAYREWKKNPATPEPKPPVKPKLALLFIPGNSSSAAVIEHLVQSDGVGIISENEADTLGDTLKHDWGNYSHMLRLLFHHETIASRRKTNDEYLEVSKPTVAVALTGTPSQVNNIIKSAENGLFSRFVYYIFKSEPRWDDVSPIGKTNFTEHFKELGEKVEGMICFLNSNPTNVHLRKEHWDDLNLKFSKHLREITLFESEEAASMIKRLGLIQFRICMTLSAIRKHQNKTTDKEVVCDDLDFLVASDMVDVYLNHSLAMLNSMRHSPDAGSLRRYFNSLPNGTFTWSQAKAVGETLGIASRTVSKYLGDLLKSKHLAKIKKGVYSKDPS